jgi:hypothetical protein
MGEEFSDQERDEARKEPGALRTYYCSLKTAVETRPVGAIPGGYRVDVAYQEGGPVRTLRKKGSAADPAVDPVDMDGSLLSGHDWIRVSENAVAHFDARITIRCKSERPNDEEQPPPPPILGARIFGKADLARASVLSAHAGDRKPEAAFQKWKDGFGNDATLPLVVSVTFDVAGPAAQRLLGSDPEQYRPYLPLDRALFTGIGRARFGAGAYSPMKELILHVYRYQEGKEASP